MANTTAVRLFGHAMLHANPTPWVPTTLIHKQTHYTNTCTLRAFLIPPTTKTTIHAATFVSLKA